MAINYLQFREVYPIQVSCASIFQGISEVHPAKDQRKKKVMSPWQSWAKIILVLNKSCITCWINPPKHKLFTQLSLLPPKKSYQKSIPQPRNPSATFGCPLFLGGNSYKGCHHMVLAHHLPTHGSLRRCFCISTTFAGSGWVGNSNWRMLPKAALLSSPIGESKHLL